MTLEEIKISFITDDGQASKFTLGWTMDSVEDIDHMVDVEIPKAIHDSIQYYSIEKAGK